MAPPEKPKIPSAAEPVHGRHFDPWNSVGTGHQRAESRGPQGWRNSRNTKLHSQFTSGHTGGKRISDTVGRGSDDFDAATQTLITTEMRTRGRNTVADMLRRPGTMQRTLSSASSEPSESVSPEKRTPPSAAEWGDPEAQHQPAEEKALVAAGGEEEKERKMFDGLVVYVNGSTHPHISDHKLKHLLAENGARMSVHLGRRQVTHVIVGRPTGTSGGAGGGLAGGKLEKEIKRVGGCGVKFVGVEW